MSTATPALLAAAAGVGFGHAVLPDHWAPLAVVGRTRNYPLARVAWLSGLAGVAHVLVSLALGGVVVAVGLQFRATVENAQGLIVGGVLVLTGVAFAALQASGHGHSHEHEHSQHEHGHQHHHHHHHSSSRGPRGIAAIMVPFGAAASPDLTILPVFLASAAVGVGTAVGSLVAFAAATIVTIVGLTMMAAVGGYRVRDRWLERWGNAVTAATLITVGSLVAGGVM